MIWKKFNEVQIENKMDLKNPRMENHPPFPIVTVIALDAPENKIYFFLY